MHPGCVWGMWYGHCPYEYAISPETSIVSRVEEEQPNSKHGARPYAINIDVEQ